MTVRSRYSGMYIPSDFFHAAVLWSEAFPVSRPLKLGHACQFHVMSKKIELADRKKQDSLLDAHDADHLFSAKVITVLLSCYSVGLSDLHTHDKMHCILTGS